MKLVRSAMLGIGFAAFAVAAGLHAGCNAGGGEHQGEYILEVAVRPPSSGTVTVDSNPAEVTSDEGIAGTTYFACQTKDLVVYVNQEPAPGFCFEAWDGDCTASGPEGGGAVTFPGQPDCQIPITKSCTAVFTPCADDGGPLDDGGITDAGYSHPDATVPSDAGGKDAATTTDGSTSTGGDAGPCSAPGDECNQSQCCTSGATCVGTVAGQQACLFSGGLPTAAFCLGARVSPYGGCTSSLTCCADSICPPPSPGSTSSECCVADGGFCDQDRLCCSGMSCDLGSHTCGPTCAPIGSLPTTEPCCAGSVLTEGACMSTAPEFSPCGANSPTPNYCAAGFACNYTLCVANGGPCTPDGGCPATYQCNGVTCLGPGPTCSGAGEGCGTGQPCCTGTSCDNGVCVELLGVLCSSGLECETGSCDPVHGTCCGEMLSTCSSDSDCCGGSAAPQQAKCNNGACCLPQGHPCRIANDVCCNGACDTSAQCP